MKQLNTQLRGIILEMQEYFFPKHCFNCKKEGSYLCQSCKNSLFFINGTTCVFCGKIYGNYCVCKQCKKDKNINSVISVFNYSDFLIRKLIKGIKYRYIKNILNDFEPLVKKFFYEKNGSINVKKDFVLIPVPLFKYKECERGFNQSREIANLFGEILNLRVIDNLLIKDKNTKNQAELDLDKREENIKNVFQVRGMVPKNVVIVDDVFTTGATVSEIARILKQSGVENINVITLARG